MQHTDTDPATVGATLAERCVVLAASPSRALHDTRVPGTPAAWRPLPRSG